MSVQIDRRWFSVDEYYRMIDAGILSADDRVELIEGEVIKMSPIGKSHAACVKRLNELFVFLVGRTATVSVQDPIRLSDFSEPQPDLALLKRRDDFYSSQWAVSGFPRSEARRDVELEFSPQSRDQC